MNALNTWKKDKRQHLLDRKYQTTTVIITSQKNRRKIEHQKQPSGGALYKGLLKIWFLLKIALFYTLCMK